MGVVNGPNCRECEEIDESMEHVLCHCPVLAETSGAMLGDNRLNMATMADVYVSSLIQFILNTGRLAGPTTRTEEAYCGLSAEIRVIVSTSHSIKIHMYIIASNLMI